MKELVKGAPDIIREASQSPLGEAQEAIGGLVQRFGRLELQTDQLEWGRSLFRVLGRLPIRCGEPL